MTWKIQETLPGLFVVDCPRSSDHRGEFAKTFHPDLMQSVDACFEIREEFYSTSKKNVIRGMHFQIPPYDHQKIVYCLSGKVLDVVVDLRKDSPKFGQVFSNVLTPDIPRLIYIPRGFAHGFLSFEDNSTLVYKTDCPYAPSSDCGIRWDSFGFEWPIASGEVIMSSRDQQLPKLADFQSPF